MNRAAGAATAVVVTVAVGGLALADATGGRALEGTEPPTPTPPAASPSQSSPSPSAAATHISYDRPKGTPKFLHAATLTGEGYPFSGLVLTDGKHEADQAVDVTFRELGPTLRTALYYSGVQSIRIAGDGPLRRLAPGEDFSGACGRDGAVGCHFWDGTIVVTVDDAQGTQAEQDDLAREALEHEIGHEISEAWGDGEVRISDTRWFRRELAKLPEAVWDSFKERGYRRAEIPDEVFAEMIGLVPHARAQEWDRDTQILEMGAWITYRRKVQTSLEDARLAGEVLDHLYDLTTAKLQRVLKGVGADREPTKPQFDKHGHSTTEGAVLPPPARTLDGPLTVHWRTEYRGRALGGHVAAGALRHARPVHPGARVPAGAGHQR